MKSWKWYVKQYKKDPIYGREKVERGKMSKKSYEKIVKDRKRSKQFEKENGFACEEVWNLDNSIAKFIYVRLAYLRDNHAGVPGTLDIAYGDVDEANKEWIRILNVMVEGFYLYTKKESFLWNEDEKFLWKLTMQYFSEYFTSLWD